MAHQSKEQHQRKGQAYPLPVEELNKQKQKAEAQEIAGRHKNDGQKGHKGER